MWEDQIVAEVQRVRDAYAARYDYDLCKIYQILKVKEAKEERPKVTFPPKLVVAEPVLHVAAE